MLTSKCRTFGEHGSFCYFLLRILITVILTLFGGQIRKSLDIDSLIVSAFS